MGDLDARPDGCVFKTSAAGLSGLFLGGILGAVQATWGDVPKVMKGKAVPALMKTGKVNQAQFVPCNKRGCLSCSAWRKRMAFGMKIRGTYEWTW